MIQLAETNVASWRPRDLSGGYPGKSDLTDRSIGFSWIWAFRKSNGECPVGCRSIVAANKLPVLLTWPTESHVRDCACRMLDNASGPAKLLERQTRMPNLRHMHNLVVLELHYVDVVRLCRPVSWWTGIACQMRSSEDAICADIVAVGIGSE
jgi:hypothetical protein